MKQAEIDREHKWKVVPKKDRPAPHPVDYPVANFGVDHDILATKASLDSTEDTLNHTWIVKDKDLKKNEYPMNYPVANFGMDHDVKDTLSNAAQAENTLNTKWIPDDLEDI